MAASLSGSFCYRLGSNMKMEWTDRKAPSRTKQCDSKTENRMGSGLIWMDGLIAVLHYGRFMGMHEYVRAFVAFLFLWLGLIYEFGFHKLVLDGKTDRRIEY